MNVLFVGGGRRVVLAKLFIERGWKVYAYETTPNMPIAHVAKVVIGKRWRDPDFSEHLLNTCHFKNIRLALPLMDAGIQACAALPAASRSTFGILATPANAVCTDKLAFEEAVLRVIPKLYPWPQRNKPAIIKPRQGFGSKGLKVVARYKGHVPKDSVVQRKIEGQEYTVDAYFDPDGKYVDAVPRLRRIVADGEVKSTVTMGYSELQDWTRIIGEAMGLTGPINMQFMVEPHEPDDIPFVTECNARFGGGWPLSIAAGLDAIGLIQRDYFGQNGFQYTPNEWIRGLATERYFEEYIYQEGEHGR